MFHQLRPRTTFGGSISTVRKKIIDISNRNQVNLV